MTWIQGQQFKPTESYQSEVEELTKQLQSLTKEINELNIQKSDLISGNAQLLKDQIAHADDVIAQAHDVKQKMLDGAAELEEQKSAHTLEIEFLQNKIKSHEQNVINFESKMNDNNLRSSAREDQLIALSNDLNKLKIELENKDKFLNEREEEVNHNYRNAVAALKIIDEKNISIQKKEDELKKREDDLALRSIDHRSQVNSFTEMKNEFESNKLEVENKHKETIDALDLIKIKTVEYNSLIIQNSSILINTKNKIDALQQETQRHYEAIDKLTNLKNYIIKQGEQNVKISM